VLNKIFRHKILTRTILIQTFFTVYKTFITMYYVYRVIDIKENDIKELKII